MTTSKPLLILFYALGYFLMQSAEAYAPVSWTLSGHASSTTHSGIGISTSTDTSGAIKPIFNAAKVNADLNAQVQITQAFSQQAPKAVGDYATSKLNEANTLRQQAKTETDPTKKTELTQQANALDANWGEGGMARVALHTAVGALSGGLAGAAGAGTSALSVPLIAAQINKLDVPPEVKQALILAAGTAVGGVTGGTAGAAAGLGQTGNNYLLHQAAAPQKSEAERYADAKKGCVSSDSRACQAKADLEMLSLSRDNQVANLCNGGADTCSSQIHTALANGSHLAWTPDGKVYVVSAESPPALTTPTEGRPQGFDQQLAPTMVDGLLLEAGNGALAGIVKGGAAVIEMLGLTARLPEATASSTALSTYRYTTEGEKFFHYGYSQQASNFIDGLRPGGYATNLGDLTGSGAQSGLALPHAAPPNAVYVVTPQPGTLVRVNPVADAKFGQPGGLPEFQFPVGTNAGSVSPFKLLP